MFNNIYPIGLQQSPEHTSNEARISSALRANMNCACEKPAKTKLFRKINHQSYDSIDFLHER